jgi:hypothetical protein
MHPIHTRLFVLITLNGILSLKDFKISKKLSSANHFKDKPFKNANKNQELLPKNIVQNPTGPAVLIFLFI